MLHCRVRPIQMLSMGYTCSPVLRRQGRSPEFAASLRYIDRSFLKTTPTNKKNKMMWMLESSRPRFKFGLCHLFTDSFMGRVEAYWFYCCRLFVLVCFGTESHVSQAVGSQTLYIMENDLEFLLLLPPPPGPGIIVDIHHLAYEVLVD